MVCHHQIPWIYDEMSLPVMSLTQVAGAALFLCGSMEIRQEVDPWGIA
jgi:hypothetical protein